MNKRCLGGLIVLAAGLYVGWQAFSNYSIGTQLADWEGTEGEIVQSTTDIDWFHRGYQIKPVLVYKYRFKGKDYQNNRISFPEPGSFSEEHAKAYIAPYPVGNPVEVFVDPSNPASACLHNKVDEEQLRTEFILSLISIGVGIFWLAPELGSVAKTGQ